MIQPDNSKNRLGSEIDVRDVRLGFFDPLLSTIFGGNAFSWQRSDHDMISWFKPVEEYSDI